MYKDKITIPLLINFAVFGHHSSFHIDQDVHMVYIGSDRIRTPEHKYHLSSLDFKASHEPQHVLGYLNFGSVINCVAMFPEC